MLAEHQPRKPLQLPCRCLQETQLCTGQVQPEDHRESGPASSPEHAARSCHSTPATPSHQQQHPESQGCPPATLAQLSGSGGIQQSLDRAYALIDFVSLSVEELQRQLHCGCYGHMCGDGIGAEQMPLLHENALGVALGAVHASSVPGIGGQALDAGPDISAQRSAIAKQLGDIRQSMQQLHTAHLHAMD